MTLPPLTTLTGTRRRSPVRDLAVGVLERVGADLLAEQRGVGMGADGEGADLAAHAQDLGRRDGAAAQGVGQVSGRGAGTC